GTTIAKYRSEALTFSAKQLATVLANRPKVVVAILKRALLILAKAPIASITPPKTIAHIISQMVLSMPDIPPAVNKSFSSLLDVSTAVSMVIAFITPL